MNILMLSADYLPKIGGIATHVHELSKALVKSGHNVWLITCKNRFLDIGYEEIDDIKIHRIFLPPTGLIGYIYYYLFAWLRIKRLIKQQNIDVLHLHTLNPDAMTAWFVGNVPKVETEHSSGFLNDMATGRHLKIIGRLLKSADYVIGPSQELVEAFITLGIPRGKTGFISNGVDQERFHPDVDAEVIRERYHIRPGAPVILCPRRLVEKTGVRYFIESIPQIVKVESGIKCLIVGDGEERAALRKRVEKLKVTENVIFAGRIENSEMPAYYAASDIVVLPSLIEATSISGLEAMASARPLLATDIGGIPQIVDDGVTGVLVPPEDPDRLALGAITLLGDADLRKKMGLAARKKVETELSWDVIARKVLDVYRDIISSRVK